jgi:hypothetical protein
VVSSEDLAKRAIPDKLREALGNPLRR